jgi:hypothetical protein
MKFDYTHASYVNAHFARHSQVTSQGTGAVNVCGYGNELIIYIYIYTLYMKDDQ